MIKRALISVSNKDGVVEFAKRLAKLDIEILSTGGTAKLLRKSGIRAKDVSDVTGFPECLDGRVKTLHPAIHGGILAMRDNRKHMRTLENLNIDTIDLVVINLYPFKETILKQQDLSLHYNGPRQNGTADSSERMSPSPCPGSVGGLQQNGIADPNGAVCSSSYPGPHLGCLEEAIENIDIGGPAMLRAAAKNYSDVTVITDPKDYAAVIEEIENRGNTDIETRYSLALKVFEHTAHYDSLIADYLRTKAAKPDIFPETLTLTYEKNQDLRYGENPHQRAAFYREIGNNRGTLADAVQLQGKELSFNNINDANGAIELLKEFEEPTAVAIKHTNPCGVASADDIHRAWQKAYESDKVSIFGGIVAVNRIITEQTAEEMTEIFLEVIIAPDFTEKALEIFSEKDNLRLVKIAGLNPAHGYCKQNCGQNHNHNNKQESHTRLHVKKVQGGILVQDKDSLLSEELEIVTDTHPSEAEIEDLLFALRVVKHVKSNAIVFARNKQTLAIGPGQTSRIWALENAIRNSVHSLEGSVLASDAFFPFRDCVDEAAKAGITAIIQPGGSVKDAESIDACNEHNISMVFTGIRHFKH